MVGLSRISLRKMGLTKAMCDGDYFCPSMKLKDLNLHKLQLSESVKILINIYFLFVFFDALFRPCQKDIRTELG